MRIDRGQIEGAGEGEEYSSIKAYRPLERYPETLFCHPQRRSSTENPIAGLTFKKILFPDRDPESATLLPRWYEDGNHFPKST